MTRFKDLPRNARTCIAMEPFWAFFGPMVVYYMPLYQRQLGLSEVQMGLVNSVNIAAGLFFYSLASPITNRFGRRNTSMWFDFIAWSLSMILWALSKSLVWFILAGVTNAVVRIVIVSWNLLISEDANDEQRSTVFGLINIIGTFGGLTTLLGGMIIARFGIDPAMRAIFWVGAVIFTVTFILRFFGTSETKAGLYIQEKSRAEPFLRLVIQQIPKAGHALRDPFFRRMTGIYIIANAVISIDFFRILYMKDIKGLSSFTISALPALSALASMVIFFIILPRQKATKNREHLANAFLACLIAQLLFIVMPKASIFSAILIFPTLQASYALLLTFRDTLFMNGTDPEQKSDRFSLVQALMMLFSIPVGWLAGLLYSAAPQLPFILAVLLYAIGYALARGLHGSEPQRG
ncbi:MAG: MFS transporter [Rectinemataceae bacterium]